MGGVILQDFKLNSGKINGGVDLHTMLYDPLLELNEFKYNSVSHTFNRAVIASYNNVMKNGIILNDKFIAVKQQQRTSIFQLNKQLNVKFPGNVVAYSEEQLPETKKIKEVCYKLKDFFDDPDKSTRRLIKFKHREKVKFNDVYDVEECLPVYDAWVKAKQADPKVFQISFNPVRYKRTYELKSKGFNIYQKLISINEVPYAIINFAIEGNNAYELSFCSKYYDKDLKLINDQNDAIIVSSLHDLYESGIETVNLGTDAGIKGLAFFKKKLPHHFCELYSRKL